MHVTSLPRLVIEPAVRTALAEDLGMAGDVTWSQSFLKSTCRLSSWPRVSPALPQD